MKLNYPHKLQELLNYSTTSGCKWSIIGEKCVEIIGINDYQVAHQGEMAWVDYEGLYHRVFASEASVIIINKEPKELPKNKTLVIVENPLFLFDHIISEYIKKQSSKLSIWNKLIKACHYKRCIGEKTRIHEGVKIAQNVCIGNNVTIYPNVVIYDNVTIGDNVVIHANTVIGGPPFSHIKQKDGRYVKRNTWGGVILLDNVEIGASCTIDRGITDFTVIGEGTKMDNHVHIGHDTWIGSHCYFSAQVAIAGYVRIKNNCAFWGRSGVINSVNVAEGTCLLSNSVITKSIYKEALTLAGYPAEEAHNYWKRKALLKYAIERNDPRF